MQFCSHMFSFSFLTINFENVIIPANDAIRNDKISQLLEKRQDADMRELNRAMNEFRMMHQQPDSRREFDLYDPDYLKKDKPARVSDDDPRCGVSSLQKFEGNHCRWFILTTCTFEKKFLRIWLYKNPSVCPFFQGDNPIDEISWYVYNFIFIKFWNRMTKLRFSKPKFSAKCQWTIVITIRKANFICIWEVLLIFKSSLYIFFNYNQYDLSHSM